MRYVHATALVPDLCLAEAGTRANAQVLHIDFDIETLRCLQGVLYNLKRHVCRGPYGLKRACAGNYTIRDARVHWDPDRAAQVSYCTGARRHVCRAASGRAPARRLPLGA